MKKSKLLRALQTLDRKEMGRFQLFIQSPYFHRPKVTREELQLLEILAKHFPDFSATDLNKKKIFERIYPGRTPVSGLLEKKMTALLKRLEHFISQEVQARSEDSFQRELDVAQFYRQRGQPQIYEMKIGRLEQTQAQKVTKEPHDLLQSFLLHREISYYCSVHNRRKDDDMHLSQLLAALDDFYFTSRFEHSCDLLYHNEFHSEIDLKDFLLIPQELTSVLTQTPYLQSPLLLLYRQLFIMLSEMEIGGATYLKNYQELERLLSKYEEQIPFRYIQNFRTVCRSYYILEFNQGRTECQKKVFELYRDDYEKGYLFFHGGIKSSAFANTVAFALREKAYDWTLRFIEANKDKVVGTHHPEGVYRFNLAQYYFAQKAYTKAKDCLLDSYEDFYYQINGKRLELKILFEEESELFDAKLDAFRLFLRRLSKKNLPERVREANNNFINILKQIRMLETYRNPERIKKLREKIQATKVIKDRTWLLEKLC